MKEFNWGTVLVAVPFAHLFLASTYLYAYCTGFGAHIASFVGVSDVFTTSIRNLAPLYAGGAAIMFLSLRHEIEAWLTSDLPQPERYGPRRPYPVPKGRFITAGKVMIVVGISASIATSFLMARPIDVVLAVSSGMAIVIFGDWMFNLSNRREVSLSVFAAYAITAALVGGLDAGQKDRHLPYDFQAKGNGTCQEFVVLRRFTDLYLAIGEDDGHRLIDAECNARVTLPKAEPKVRASELPVWIRWFFEP